jgi:16S rRNA C1402 (ribose-2'-O) methylase RsmI
MAIYFLMGVTIVLAGVAGLQLFYLGYLERLGKEQKRRITELEKHSAHLSRRLADAEDNLAHQAEMIQSMEYYEDDDIVVVPEDEEIWADVIEDV